MRRVETPCFAAFSIVMLLLHSADAKADCVKPAWPDPVTLRHLEGHARLDYVFAFQNRIHEFIACQRDSLQKRTRVLAPSGVAQFILQDRATEERALAEAGQLDSCIFAARRETEPATVRASCEKYVDSAMQERRSPERPTYTTLEGEQRSAYGGTWSYRTFDIGRQGYCDDAECDIMFGVEVTNLTPVALRCEVALAISNFQDGRHRGEEVITLNPGDSLPAARVQIPNSPEDIEPEVTCSRAMPLGSDSHVPAACLLRWRAWKLPHSKGRTSHSWESGRALVEFTAAEKYESPKAIRIVGADSDRLGLDAQAQIAEMRVSTNCASQRFRMRVEFRSFPCYVCLMETGIVTLYWDDRVLR